MIGERSLAQIKPRSGLRVQRRLSSLIRNVLARGLWLWRRI